MNSKGFTLVEMLGCMAILGLVLTIALFVTKDTLSTSLTQISSVSTNEIIDAAQAYVQEDNISFNESGYVCVSIQTLVDLGFLDNFDNDKQKEFVKLTRNNDTKVINDKEIVDICN